MAAALVAALAAPPRPSPPPRRRPAPTPRGRRQAVQATRLYQRRVVPGQASGKLVVTVTSAAGRQDRQRGRCRAPLRFTQRRHTRNASATIDRTLKISGISWAADPASDQFVLLGRLVGTGARLAQVQKVASRSQRRPRQPDRRRVLDRAFSGGDAILRRAVSLSLGFNVRTAPGRRYFLTAVTAGTSPRRGTQLQPHHGAGSTAGSSFPGNDYAIVRYTNTGITASGVVDLYNGSSQDITPPATPMSVSRPAQRQPSGVHSGTVQASQRQPSATPKERSPA